MSIVTNAGVLFAAKFKSVLGGVQHADLPMLVEKDKNTELSEIWT